MKKLYAKFFEEELILRDHLAIDRTMLANERTLLAYIRTAIAIVIAGGSLIKFFSEQFYHVLGFVLILAGVITLILGFWRYRSINHAINLDQEKVK